MARESRRHMEVKEVVSLEEKYADAILQELRRRNGIVFCTNNYDLRLWIAPAYVFDAVSRGGIATVSEIKRYVAENPAD